MFTGLTNQVSSWMGSAKGEQEEKVPTPTEDTNPELSEKKEGISPTKHSKLEMFSNVKNQIGGIGGWLGSSIPKLRKGEGEVPAGSTEETVGAAPAEDEVANLTSDLKATNISRDDDDNSSATGGADSGPASATESPTDETKDGQFGNVQSKALAGAKTIGSFLYSAVNKAGKTVSEASAKIKETVEKNTILGEFNKEQEAFAKSQSGDGANAVPPWTGCQNEEALKQEFLSLSTNKRNFVRSPPAEVDFSFNYDESFGVAMAIMEHDPNLEKMRYELVPKVISEENFWRNYFYRVSLICQANEYSYNPRDESQSETVSDQPSEPKSSEFISDTLQVSKNDLDEVKAGMKKLALGPRITGEFREHKLIISCFYVFHSRIHLLY